jgi:arylamine N-acetyltransferase
MPRLTESELLEIKSRLGLGRLTNDREGLRAFYRAWCLNVPFDDLQKTLVLFENPGPPLPPLDSRQFFQDWLTCGTGGTCWQHSDALYTLLCALGFDARRAVASMYDMGVPGHATVIVRLPDASHWILDNALLTMEPLRMDREAPSFFRGAFYAEVELEGDQVYVHGIHPPMDDIFFRLLDHDVPESFYATRWAGTHLSGPFVRTAHVRKNFADRFCVLRGNTLYTVQGEVITTQTVGAEEVVSLLKETFGIAGAFVDRWVASGALESSMQPSAPPPDLPQRSAPSNARPSHVIALTPQK